MNALDEWSKAKRKSHEAKVKKVVEISQNDTQWLNLALCRAFFYYKISFTVY